MLEQRAICPGKSACAVATAVAAPERRIIGSVGPSRMTNGLADHGIGWRSGILATMSKGSPVQRDQLWPGDWRLLREEPLASSVRIHSPLGFCRRAQSCLAPSGTHWNGQAWPQRLAVSWVLATRPHRKRRRHGRCTLPNDRDQEWRADRRVIRCKGHSLTPALAAPHAGKAALQG